MKSMVFTHLGKKYKLKTTIVMTFSRVVKVYFEPGTDKFFCTFIWHKFSGLARDTDISQVTGRRLTHLKVKVHHVVYLMTQPTK